LFDDQNRNSPDGKIKRISQFLLRNISLECYFFPDDQFEDRAISTNEGLTPILSTHFPFPKPLSFCDTSVRKTL
jgi:hypothetical protein